MKRIFFSFIIPLVFIFFSFKKPVNLVQVTYLGNCSFVYQDNSSKVLIDPFGKKYGSYFYLPSDSIQTKILNAEKPFNDVDLLLITHIHGDHYDPVLTSEFLVSHPKAKLVCPNQVYQNLQDTCQNFEQIKAQIISPKLPMGTSQNLEINGVELQVLRMQHGSDRCLDGINYSDYTEYEKTENFGYVLNLKDQRIFHQGDACLKFNKKALANIKAPVDIAYLSFFDWDYTSYRILKDKLEASDVIFMHGTVPAYELKDEKFAMVLPSLILFDEAMDNKTFR